MLEIAIKVCELFTNRGGAELGYLVPNPHSLAWRRTPLKPLSDRDWHVTDARGQIARVMLVEHGPEAGRWQWFARAATLPNQGTEPTKETAMAAAKARWEADPLEL